MFLPRVQYAVPEPCQVSPLSISRYYCHHPALRAVVLPVRQDGPILLPVLLSSLIKVQVTESMGVNRIRLDIEPV